MKLRNLTLTLAVCCLSLTPQYVYQKVSMEMLTRSMYKGKLTSLKATVFYTSAGKMVSHYQEPTEMLISNNAKGEISLYNFKDNTVIQKQNSMMSTDVNQLFYFLENNKSDLGLAKIGFALIETKFKDGLKVTVWAPPMPLVRQISKVELAHDKSNPVFLGYFDMKGKAINKAFFYDYTMVGGLQFPASVTYISFKSANDSIIAKTSYFNFKIDQQVDEQYLNFNIPANAKVTQ